MLTSLIQGIVWHLKLLSDVSRTFMHVIVNTVYDFLNLESDSML